jgi:predicted RNase H-like HicB family nuclease
VDAGFVRTFACFWIADGYNSAFDFNVRHNGSPASWTVLSQRFHTIIGGREYTIEVARVADNRWRAQIVKLPGIPTALMPFYGSTPDDAAAQLSEWLTRAHQHAATALK